MRAVCCETLRDSPENRIVGIPFNPLYILVVLWKYKGTCVELRLSKSVRVTNLVVFWARVIACSKTLLKPIFMTFVRHFLHICSSFCWHLFVILLTFVRHFAWHLFDIFCTIRGYFLSFRCRPTKIAVQSKELFSFKVWIVLQLKGKV